MDLSVLREGTASWVSMSTVTSVSPSQHEGTLASCMHGARNSLPDFPNWLLTEGTLLVNSDSFLLLIVAMKSRHVCCGCLRK